LTLIIDSDFKRSGTKVTIKVKRYTVAVVVRIRDSVISDLIRLVLFA